MVAVAVDEVPEKDEADYGGSDTDEAEEEDKCNCVQFSAAEREGPEDEEWDGYDCKISQYIGRGAKSYHYHTPESRTQSFRIH